VRTDGVRLRWLAVGDAALSVDPISGSGVIRALRTARAAADTAVASLSGDAAAIPQYENDRDEECTTYLTTRAGYYRIERRWAGSPFWDRRSRTGVARQSVRRTSTGLTDAAR
jgi:flavin-dependent dehydrogenase